MIIINKDYTMITYIILIALPLVLIEVKGND